MASDLLTKYLACLQVYNMNQIEVDICEVTMATIILKGRRLRKHNYSAKKTAAVLQTCVHLVQMNNPVCGSSTLNGIRPISGSWGSPISCALARSKCSRAATKTPETKPQKLLIFVAPRGPLVEDLQQS